MTSLKILLPFIGLLFFLQPICQAQELTMFPGFFGMEYYKDSQKIDRSTMTTLMQQDEVAFNLWGKADRHQVISWVAFGAQVGFLALWANSTANDRDATLPIIGTLGATITSVGFALSSGQLRKRSILAYNQGLEATSWQLGPTRNGIGFVLTF